jgi:hypothetical protein
MADAYCQRCGRRVEPDPDGSGGAWLHDRDLGAETGDADEDHAARAPQEQS